MPLLPNEIGDDEDLFRGVIANPNMWNEKEGRPTSAIFKDSNGVSVDRDGGRNDTDSVNYLCERLKKKGTELRAVVKISAGVCRSCETLPLAKPCRNNPYHAEIHESQQKVEISSSKGSRKNKITFSWA